ncbi:pentapeptide repeat-containing protein [Pseudonocardia alaniniphila]|uniref:Pentapeptide repeat-containing protein n=1 Tax=Pseudonocardia alaniniphila TaxID=75291 RepID=A0ABS9TBL9_9PSEU|nr:pentapeptide repeat-containing protein [Pseudonocardia alaniniphila]MCH6165902.1 pentapeptide repeat-containing protein [Pseudonocardia alaniniphila]
MRGRVLLAASVLAAILVTASTTVVLLLVEPTASKAEAIKTGGLAGGAVVALYALWLNDRRRRTEEARHELESDKVADERFARSVELLGNEADQVRVGALHALAWLADSSPRYKQTVLDVLCAYLRRPFSHPSYTQRADDPDQTTTDEAPEADRERQVRLTAQRLITDLLPWGTNHDPRAYHLDLTGASLEHFRLEGRRIGRLTARRTRFYGITRLGSLQASKPALFSGAAFLGRVDMRDARFEGGISFQHATFCGEVAFSGASVGTFIDVETTSPELHIGAIAVAEGSRVDGDPATWPLVGLPPSPARAGA